MRVITGSARGRRLESLPGTDTMPTTASVKEAMMSTIQFEIEGAKVLDLFAGTGQLGIEVLSRGASSCTFVDQSPRCGRLIKDNLTHTKLDHLARVEVADSTHWITTSKGPFDIAFVDPPYNNDIIPSILPAIAGAMSPSGAILCETGAKEELPQEAGEFVIKKEYHYGKKKVTLYRKRQEAEN